MVDFIDENEIKKLLPLLNEYNDWLPLVLFKYINHIAYFSRVSDDIITDFYDRKHDAMMVENPNELLEYDLRLWIEDNPDFKTIIRKAE